MKDLRGWVTARVVTGMCKEVLVYSGDGAGVRSVQSAVQTLRSTLRLGPSERPTLQVATLGTAELLAGHWRRRCLLLVMPGGADLPYCRDLNGTGNKLISGFVRNDGGAYLGLCAGAYYASARVEFQAGTRLEVTSGRELQFFNGTAEGAVVPGFSYMSEAGAAATELRFLRLPEAGDQSAAERDPCADSGGAVLSDVCYDYCNGGCSFQPRSGNSFASIDGVTVLARYHGGAATGEISAVAMRAGKGRAVLTGTHPELHPDWLADAADADKLVAAGCCSQSEAVRIAARATEVRQRLASSQAGRMRFWRLLLAAAGLGQHLSSEVCDAAGAT